MNRVLKPLRTVALLYVTIVLCIAQLQAQKAAKTKSSQAAKTTVAPTPPLGYNSFDSYGINIYEERAMKEIDSFIEKFAPHGYEYFVIDNGWFASPSSVQFEGLLVPTADKTSPDEISMDEYGIVQPSKLFFPNGLKPMIDKLHANGLKFGVHLMRGIPKIAVEKNLPIKGTKYRAQEIYTSNENCTWCLYMHGVDMTKLGAQEYYNSVINQFAEWGIDFIKVDDVTQHPAEIEGYAKAIAQCSRPIVLSLSAGGVNSETKYIETYRKANMVRTTPDIWDNPESLERSFSSMRKWQGLEQKGFSPDLDMIPFGELCILRRPEIQRQDQSKSIEAAVGKMHHWCKFTEAEKETFITQRAISSSPIMIGGSMISMDDHSYKLLTHPQMLACVKNNVHGKLFYEENDIELWCAPIANNARYGFQEYVYKEGWVAIFNRSDKDQTLSLKGRFLRFLPEGIYRMDDLWGDQSVARYKRGNDQSFRIESHGVVFLKYSPVQ